MATGIESGVPPTHGFIALPLSFPCPRSIRLPLTALVMILLMSSGLMPIGHAADLETTRMLVMSGRYEEAESVAAAEVERGVWNERWPRLLIQCQMATGQYADALDVYRNAIRRYSTSLTLRWMGLDVLRMNGLEDEVQQADQEFRNIITRSSFRFPSRDNLVAIGRYLTEAGEDAREVLKQLYDQVLESDPSFLEAYIATAELAIAKGDFKVAAETLDKAELVDASDPRVFLLMAKAWSSSDGARTQESINRALQLNPRHADSMLFSVDHLIDREDYQAAKELIAKVLSTNVHHPDAWAYLAALAHLQGQYEAEPLYRAAALSTWSSNSNVDHLIGRKLSDKYRFSEGEAYQRRALEIDPQNRAAQFHLAQDLLRLGKAEEGWTLARSVADQDQYNVVAFNLVTLYDRLKSFSTLERDGIFVRMSAGEAAIYGDRVLDLLDQARHTLAEKYESQLQYPIFVEIYPQQKDFAIRTFGLPGGAGFLGVCFGSVITANSPASQTSSPQNWQSVLWHEFCHVVTLQKTNNRMPRWLSEGISVYEERQRDASWGEKLTPVYRQMLLDELVPVSQLSGAFLNPKSAVHLQFAYYQSSLVVEFLIDEYGQENLLAVLHDLRDGLGINEALEKNLAPIGRLDQGFQAYATETANQFGPDIDWSRDQLPEKADVKQWVQWNRDHPNNYWGGLRLAEAYLRVGAYSKAEETLLALQQAGGDSVSEGVLARLAQVQKRVGRRGGVRGARRRG
ncbi:MAG: tetratricopeptide repeat protein, partial [Planctomycetota bacterium]